MQLMGNPDAMFDFFSRHHFVNALLCGVTKGRTGWQQKSI